MKEELLAEANNRYGHIFVDRIKVML